MSSLPTSTTTTYIQPARRFPLAKERDDKIYLHMLDLIPDPIQTRIHRFYRFPGSYNNNPTTTSSIHTRRDAFIRNLQDSLSQALELYLPVSGVVRTDEQGKIYIAIDEETRYDGKGTPFIVEHRDSPFNGDDEESLAARDGLVLPAEAPTFACKVTFFSCGTFCIASSMHHQVTDLSGFLDFLHIWTLLIRGETISTILPRIPKNWTRTPGRFFPPSQAAASSGSSSALDLENAAPGFTALNAEEVQKNAAKGPPAWMMAPAQALHWRFSRLSLVALKDDINKAIAAADSAGIGGEESSSSHWVSSGDALAAVLWSAVTRARESAGSKRLDGRSDSDKGTESLWCAADGRARAPVPKSTLEGAPIAELELYTEEDGRHPSRYFGNFNTLCCIRVPVVYLSARSTDLHDNHDGSLLSNLARVALGIRNSIKQQMSAEAVAAKISYMNLHQDATNRQGRMNFLMKGVDCILTNWSKFDLGGEKADLSRSTTTANTTTTGISIDDEEKMDEDDGLGQPFLATSGQGQYYPPGYGIMMKDGEGGDVSVLLSIEREAIEALKGDCLLCKYAELRE